MGTNRVQHDGQGGFYTDAEKHSMAIRPFKASEDSFADQAEMLTAMRDPRYQTSEGYRAEVARLIGNSDGVALGIEQAPDIVDQNADEIDIRREMMLTVFGSEEYKNSPAYRRQVMETIRNDRSCDGYHQDAGSLQQWQAPSKETGPMKPMEPVVPQNEDDK